MFWWLWLLKFNLFVAGYNNDQNHPNSNKSTGTIYSYTKDESSSATSTTHLYLNESYGIATTYPYSNSGSTFLTTTTPAAILLNFSSLIGFTNKETFKLSNGTTILSTPVIISPKKGVELVDFPNPTIGISNLTQITDLNSIDRTYLTNLSRRFVKLVDRPSQPKTPDSIDNSSSPMIYQPTENYSTLKNYQLLTNKVAKLADEVREAQNSSENHIPSQESLFLTHDVAKNLTKSGSAADELIELQKKLIQVIQKRLNSQEMRISRLENIIKTGTDLGENKSPGNGTDSEAFDNKSSSPSYLSEIGVRVKLVEYSLLNLTQKHEILQNLALIEKMDLEIKVDELHKNFENLTISNGRLSEKSQGQLLKLKNSLNKMQFEAFQRQETLDVLYNGQESSNNLLNQVKVSVDILKMIVRTMGTQLDNHTFQLLNLSHEVCKDTNEKLKIQVDMGQLTFKIYNHSTWFDKLGLRLRGFETLLRNLAKKDDLTSLKKSVAELEANVKRIEFNDLDHLQMASDGVSSVLDKISNMFPTDCSMDWNYGGTISYRSGVYLIRPKLSTELFEVYCDIFDQSGTDYPSVLIYDKKSSPNVNERRLLGMSESKSLKTKNGGGWIVIQRRINGTNNFTRPWEDYKRGFGDLLGEFWLGNEKLYQLTNSENYMLRIDMVVLVAYELDLFEPNRSTVYRIEYSGFKISNESTGYALNLGDVMSNKSMIKMDNSYKFNETDQLPDTNFSTLKSSNTSTMFINGPILKFAEDCLKMFHNGMKFSTIDKDLDVSSIDCAKYYSGGWWYSHCQKCNLNGRYGIGITWYQPKLKEWLKIDRVEMKIKRNSY